MRGLGRNMAGDRMRQRVGAQFIKRRDCGGANEAVEHDRNASAPRRQRGAKNGGKLAAAERRGNRVSFRSPAWTRDDNRGRVEIEALGASARTTGSTRSAGSVGTKVRSAASSSSTWACSWATVV